MKNIILSVVIPCYNEEKNLPAIIEEFEKEIGKKNVELILVNNGSTDNSEKILKQSEKKHSFIRTLRLEKNIGYGNGIWAGLKDAKGEFVGWTHADLQTPPKDVLRGLDIIMEQNAPKKSFVKGKRINRSLFDAFFSFGMGFFCSLVLGKWLYEINAQPSIVHKSFLEKISNPPKDFSFDLYALYTAKKLGMNIVRFEVTFFQRIHGKSSWNTGIAGKLKLIKRTIAFTLKLRGRPND